MLNVSDNRNASGGSDPAIDDTLALTIDVTDVDEFVAAPSISIPGVQAPRGASGGSSGGSGGGSGSGSGGGGDFDVGVAVFVVANGWSPADVGVASVLAARTDGGVVTYTAGDVLSAETAVLVREALPAEVVIVGGTAAVSFGVRSGIRAASQDSGVVRVTGAGRAETAAAAARRVLGVPSSAGRVTVVVANGWSPPDIGAAASLAARTRRSAVLYAQQGVLPEESAAVLRDYDVARVVLVGGTAALSSAVEDEVAAAAGADAGITRLIGADRVETAAAAARRVLGSPAGAPEGVTLVVANGWSPPDVGVAAAYAAATDNAAVAYTTGGSLPEATRCAHSRLPARPRGDHRRPSSGRRHRARRHFQHRARQHPHPPHHRLHPHPHRSPSRPQHPAPTQLTPTTTAPRPSDPATTRLAVVVGWRDRMTSAHRARWRGTN